MAADQPEFLQRSARRMFLAETILWVGSYLIFTVTALLLADSRIACENLFLGAGLCLALLWIGGVTVIVITAHSLCRAMVSGWKRNLVGIGWGIFLLFGAITIMAGSSATRKDIFLFEAVFLFPAMLFLYTFLIPVFGQSRRTKLAAWLSGLLTLAGIAGLLLPLLTIFCLTLSGLIIIPFALPLFGQFCEHLFPTFLVFNWQWNLFFLGAFVLIFAGYLLRGALLAALSRQSYRMMLCRKLIPMMWSLAAVSWLFMLILMLQSGLALHKAEECATAFFGSPLTVDALREVYYEGKTPDPEAWQKLSDAIAAIDERYQQSRYEPTCSNYVLTPAQRQECLAIQKELAGEFAVIDRMFGATPPKIEFRYPGDASMDGIRHLSTLREIVRLELWRIKLALAYGDKAAALTSYQHLVKLNSYLKGEVTIIDHLVRLATVSIQLSALRILLESDQLTEEELLSRRDELNDTFRDTQAVLRRSLYGELTLELRTLDITARMRNPSDVDFSSPRIDFRSLRWLFPQFEYFLRRNMIDMIDYDIRFARDDGNVTPHGVFTELMAPSECYRSIFDRFEAELIATQVLIDVELYRRRHGRYPEMLPETEPRDPFGGAPFRYAVTTEEVDFRKPVDPPPKPPEKIELPGEPGVLTLTEPQEKSVVFTKTVPVVMVWSIGPNLRDDHGKLDGKADDRTAQKRLKPILGEP